MERFSIDDAIKQSKIVANRYKWSVENADMGSEDANELNADICNRYVKEYRQIAKWLEEFKSYKQAEEQGLLVRLPCKVGDTVYVKLSAYCKSKYAEAQVRDYTYFTSCGFCVVVTSTKFEKQSIPFSEFGKTVFLTREEAEKKLEEMKNE